MKKRNVRSWAAALLALVLLGGLLAGCAPEVKVGALQTESQSVELGGASSVRVQIDMGAGQLKVKGGAAKLMEADFAYNVARLKPEVKYADGTLVVQQPDTSGFPNIQGVTDFRNEWDLRLEDGVPMNLRLNVGGGSANLDLAGLALTGLDVKAGAGQYTIDLSGDWARNLDAIVDAGAADVTLRLPKAVGARVKVESGPHTIQAAGLKNDGDAYTNAAYGSSKATLQVDLKVGVGRITLEEEGRAAAAAQSRQQAEAGAALQGLLDDQVQKQGILGMAMAVRLADGTVVWKGSGYLEPEKKNRWTPDTLTAVGSVTKSFTAVVIMQLVQEGKLSLEDTIDRWFPDQPNGDKITVRMLLAHTSGLANYINVNNHFDPKWGRAWAPRDLVAEANKMGAVDEPGKAAHYSNTGYTLLGLITEAITGQSWEQAVRSRIFEPLHLKHTTFLSEKGVVGGSLMPGYARTPNGWVSSLKMTNYPHASTTWAVGSVVTTLSDLTTFATGLFDGALVSKETLAEMATPVKKDVESGLVYGLGGATVETIPGSFGMGGDVPGYVAFFGGIQNTKYVVAALVNTDEGDVIGPSMMALDYARSMRSSGQAPAAPAATPQQPSPQQPDPGAALQGLLDDQVKKQGILGMAMAVRMADGTVISRFSGYIDPAKSSPWTADTVSMLGSITKTYTAAVIMQLVKEGKLSLDDTIDKWFPDQPNGDKITVRMLLSHTSGLAEYLTEKNLNDPRWTREFPPTVALAEANRLGPVDKPGTKVAHYANTNYFVLGMIVEAVTGESWEQAVRSRIIEPLHLEHTAMVTEKPARAGTVVKGYFKTPSGYISFLDVPNRPSASTAWANGGVVSSLADLVTFASALFDGKLVSRETLAEMGTGIADDPDGVRAWGLGGATIKKMPGSFGMGGDAEAYHSFFAGIQGTKYLVAALVNTSDGEPITPSLMALEYLRSLPAAAPAQ